MENMDKNFVFLFLIPALVLATSLGFFGVACVGGMNHPCPMFLSFGTGCSFLTGFGEITQFTLNAFSSIVLAIGLLALAFLYLRKDQGRFSEYYNFFRNRIFEKPLFIEAPKILHWLSLKNKLEPNSHLWVHYTI